MIETTDRVEGALRDLMPKLPAEMEPQLVERVSGLLDRERQRAVELCRKREELWRNTTLAKSDIPAAREEARARANEAASLADLLDMDPER